jgi:hypothetical protein
MTELLVIFPAVQAGTNGWVPLPLFENTYMKKFPYVYG